MSARAARSATTSRHARHCSTRARTSTTTASPARRTSTTSARRRPPRLAFTRTPPTTPTRTSTTPPATSPADRSRWHRIVGPASRPGPQLSRRPTHPPVLPGLPASGWSWHPGTKSEAIPLQGPSGFLIRGRRTAAHDLIGSPPIVPQARDLDPAWRARRHDLIALFDQLLGGRLDRGRQLAAIALRRPDCLGDSAPRGVVELLIVFLPGRNERLLGISDQRHQPLAGLRRTRAA